MENYSDDRLSFLSAHYHYLFQLDANRSSAYFDQIWLTSQNRYPFPEDCMVCAGYMNFDDLKNIIHTNLLKTCLLSISGIKVKY